MCETFFRSPSLPPDRQLERTDLYRPLSFWAFAFNREVIQPDVMEEMVVSCVIKHLNLVDALQSLINFQYQEEHAEEYDLLCKIMGETFKKLNAMERQLQVKRAVKIWFLQWPLSAAGPGRLMLG